MFQNSIYDNLLKCNLRSHHFFREIVVPPERENYNVDRNILAYHLKKYSV